MPASTVTSTRFHRAARDGLVDVIREASSRDVNQRDDLGMTPTAWAAFSGQTHVLRVLVSKGGVPGRADNLGNTALHLAAVNGHNRCVHFLCAMGEDVWAMNIDRRTPRDLAATHPRGEAALRCLDSTMAREMSLDPKRCAAKRQRAAERAAKCLAEFQRSSEEFRQRQLEERRVLMERSAAQEDDVTSLSSSTASSAVQQMWAAVKNANRRRPSAESNATSAVSSTVARSYNFGVGSVNTDGTRTIRPISGLAPSTEVLFSKGGFRRHSIQSTGSSMAESVTDAFDLAQQNQTGLVILTPSDSSDQEPEDEVFNTERRRSSIFDRPGFGHVAFRHSIAGLEEFTPTTESATSNWSFKGPDQVDSAGESHHDSELDSLPDFEEASPLISFLVAWDLLELAPLLTPLFRDDLEALLVANDADLKLAGLVTGPRKKLLRAIELHNEEIDNHGEPEDTRL